MKKVISCEYNMDNGCVKLRMTDCSLISINCTAVENEVADKRFERSELDYLIYNDPAVFIFNKPHRKLEIISIDSIHYRFGFEQQ